MSVKSRTSSGYSRAIVVALSLLVQHPDYVLLTQHTRRDGEDGAVWLAYVANPHAGDIGRVHKRTVPTPSFRVMLREQLLAQTDQHVNSHRSTGEGRLVEEYVVTTYRPSYAGEIIGRAKEVAS